MDFIGTSGPLRTTSRTSWNTNIMDGSGGLAARQPPQRPLLLRSQDCSGSASTPCFQVISVLPPKCLPLHDIENRPRRRLGAGESFDLRVGCYGQYVNETVWDTGSQARSRPRF